MASIRPTEWKRTSADCREERERRREWQAGALCVCAANTGDSPKWSSRQLHVCCDKWLLPLFCATGTKPRALEESASDLNIAQRAHAAARLLKFQGSDVSRDSVRRSRQRNGFLFTPPHLAVGWLPRVNIMSVSFVVARCATQRHPTNAMTCEWHWRYTPTLTSHVASTLPT